MIKTGKRLLLSFLFFSQSTEAVRCIFLCGSFLKRRLFSWCADRFLLSVLHRVSFALLCLVAVCCLFFFLLVSSFCVVCPPSSPFFCLLDYVHMFLTLVWDCLLSLSAVAPGLYDGAPGIDSRWRLGFTKWRPKGVCLAGKKFRCPSTGRTTA